MPTDDPSTPVDFREINRLSGELARAEAERKQREREARDRRISAESAALMEANDQLMKMLLFASVALPLLVMWMLGDQMERWLYEHHVHGTSYMLTLAAPIAISIVLIKDIVVDWLLFASYGRSLDALYGHEKTPMPKAVDRLLGLMYCLKAGSIIVPVSLLLVFGRGWDGVFGETGPIFAIVAIVATWALVKYVLLQRVIAPWRSRLVHDAIYGQTPDSASAAT